MHAVLTLVYNTIHDKQKKKKNAHTKDTKNTVLNSFQFRNLARVQ